MAVRNRRPDLNGLLIIDKPLGWTSSHVCRHIRRISGGAKVGHAGTLDPLATGVLVVCLGKATKLVDELMSHDKAYRAEIDLSRTSESHDLERTTVECRVGAVPDSQCVERTLRRFVGTILQVPPAHSAVKVDGERAYALARRGDLACPSPIDKAVPTTARTLQARPVRIDSIELTRFEWPMLALTIHCGKGTYIRSLARDLGHALNTGGVLTSLIRTRSGVFTLEHARKLDELRDPIRPSDLLALDAETVRPAPE